MTEECEELLSLEDGFCLQMKNRIEPYLNGCCREGFYTGADGLRLHYSIYEAAEPAGSVLLIHGFSEFGAKYAEMIYCLLKMNFTVYVPELRGHGKSEREVADPSKVYVDSFEKYVKDIKNFADSILRGDRRPEFLLGHSMGGAVAALYAEENPDDFPYIVLSSPMIQVQLGKHSPFLAGTLAKLKLFWGEGGEYVRGQQPFTKEPDIERSSCSSEERYRYTFGLRCADKLYQTWSPTYGWLNAALAASGKLMKNAERITGKVLVLYAGRDTLVKPDGTVKFCEKLGNGRACYFPEAKHEVFNSDKASRFRYYENLFEFMTVQSGKETDNRCGLAKEEYR